MPTAVPDSDARPGFARENGAKPIRVLRIIARLNMGGPTHNARLLSTRLDSDRYVTLLVHGSVGPGEAVLPPSGREADVRSRLVPQLGPSVRPMLDVRALYELIRIVRAFQPDIVHTHTAKAGILGRMAALAGRGSRPVLVHTYHGHVLEGYFGPLATASYRVLERGFALVTDRLVGVSQQTVDDLVRLRVARRDKFSLVRVGLDLDGFSESNLPDRLAARTALGLAEDDIAMVFVGRLAPVKRLDVMLEAMSLALRREPRLVLLIVGDGSLRDSLEHQAERLGVARRTRFLGYRDELSPVYAASDMAVLSSDNEGTPVSLIEAAAAGLPAVSAAVGGVAEVVSSETGLLVHPRDAAGLAGGMVRLATDPSLRARLGAAARRRVVAGFNADRLVTDVDALYSSLLERRAAAR